MLIFFEWAPDVPINIEQVYDEENEIVYEEEQTSGIEVDTIVNNGDDTMEENVEDNIEEEFEIEKYGDTKMITTNNPVLPDDSDEPKLEQNDNFEPEIDRIDEIIDDLEADISEGMDIINEVTRAGARGAQT